MTTTVAEAVGARLPNVAKLSHPIRKTGARVIMTVALAVGLGAGLTACHHPLIVPVSPPVGLKNCFEDLPLAEGALNAPKGSYEFLGLKLVSPKDMAQLVKQRFPKNPSSSFRAPPAGAKVCAFAFKGDFPAGQVAVAPPNASGKAAIVLATTDRKLLFSFVLAKLPETFSRSFTSP